jgi:uncharacterized BrkB/YihY/UPF0761 family membrane protein
MTTRLSIKLSPLNLALGVGFVVVALALFTWLLPMFVPPDLIYAFAGAAIGILFWFLFLVARQGTE